MQHTTLDDAFGLLLKRMGMTVPDGFTLGGEPEKLLDINVQFPEIDVVSMGPPGTWPDTNDALISFQIGGEYPEMQEAYYLVADYEKQLVVNPKNGKKVHIIAEPIGWISYGPAVDPAGELQDKPEYRYTWVKHDNIWDVARRTGNEAKEILEHNDITDASDIQPGTILHLPHPRKLVEEKVITYELTPKQMHITHEGGAHKWGFGNAKKISQVIKSSHTYAWNAPIDVVATAHVPLEEGTATYYMTASDFGNYRESGRVTNSIGFNHTHLAEGEPVEVPIAPVEPIVTPEVVIEDVRMSHMEDPNAYKISWHRFRETGIYRVIRDVWVKEYDGRQQDHFLSEGEKVELIGTFMRGEVIYGRPYSGTNAFWFGVPMHCLEPIDENSDIDEIAKQELPEKIAARRSHVAAPVLRPSEKVFDIFSHAATRPLALSVKVKRYIKRRDAK